MKPNFQQNVQLNAHTQGYLFYHRNLFYHHIAEFLLRTGHIMDRFSVLHIAEWVYLLQSSPQIEKHMLLRELTEDTHTGRSKGKVLNELAACIAAGLS